MDQAVFDKVKEVIVEVLGVDEDKVVPEASFKDDLNADSLDLMELVMGLEAAFDLEISDDDLAKITTVQAAVDYISQDA